MSSKLVEELKELEAREGVFFGTDSNLKDLQYNKAMDSMVDVQLTDCEYDYEYKDNHEIFNGVIEGLKVTFLIDHENKTYNISLPKD